MIRSVSIERGLLERISRFLVLLADFGWDDVGTWASLRRARELDDDGNGALGAVSFVDSESNVVHTEAGTVVLFGVSRFARRVAARPDIHHDARTRERSQAAARCAAGKPPRQPRRRSRGQLAEVDGSGILKGVQFGDEKAQQQGNLHDMTAPGPFFYKITDGIRVTVRPVYLPEQSIPEQQQFVFAYYVRIENVGTQSAQLLLAPLADSRFDR